MRLSFPLAIGLTLTILAGCGGSSHPGETGVERVTTFPLAKAYDPALFDRVKPEIERVAAQLAAKLKARTTERTVTVAGQKSLQFDLTHGGVTEQVTFVLLGKKEYELYCSRAAAASCKRLVETFSRP